MEIYIMALPPFQQNVYFVLKLFVMTKVGDAGTWTECYVAISSKLVFAFLCILYNFTSLCCQVSCGIRLTNWAQTRLGNVVSKYLCLSCIWKLPFPLSYVHRWSIVLLHNISHYIYKHSWHSSFVFWFYSSKDFNLDCSVVHKSVIHTCWVWPE